MIKIFLILIIIFAGCASQQKQGLSKEDIEWLQKGKQDLQEIKKLTKDGIKKIKHDKIRGFLCGKRF